MLRKTLLPYRPIELDKMEKTAEHGVSISARFKELRVRFRLVIPLVLFASAVLPAVACAPFDDGSHGIAWQNQVGCRESPDAPSGDSAFDHTLCQTVPVCTRRAIDFRSDCRFRDWWLSFALAEPTAASVKAAFLERFQVAAPTTTGSSSPSSDVTEYRELVADAYAAISEENAGIWQQYLMWQATESVASDSWFQRMDAAETILRAVPISPTSSFTAWQTRAADYAQSLSDTGDTMPPGFSSSKSAAKFEQDTVRYLQLLLAEVGT